MSEQSTQPHKTFRGAYCAHFNCSPERFVDSVFWHALYRHALPLAWPIWLMKRDFFKEDFAVIDTFGSAGTTRQVTQATGEFSGSSRTGGGFLRRILRVRISGTRLTGIHDQLVSRMAADVPAKQTQPAPITSFSTMRPASVGATSRGIATAGPAEGLSLINRRCRSAHDEITRGKPLDVVLRDLGISEEKLLEHLKQNSPANPQYAWLHDYLKRDRRLTELARDNEVLSRKVTSLTLEVDRLKETLIRIP
ncbi:MAG: hypothetical protein EXS36_09685 [Pedosphaera sp.]|nr:hypothetical protein [Pedosphaera sp.]